MDFDGDYRSQNVQISPAGETMTMRTGLRVEYEDLATRELFESCSFTVDLYGAEHGHDLSIRSGKAPSQVENEQIRNTNLTS